jgi:hypothetical protein
MRLKSALLLLSAAATISVLTACTAEEIHGPGYHGPGYHGPGYHGPRYPSPGYPGRGYHERPRFCSSDYAPVCAARGGYRKTFSNACHADSEDYRIVFHAPC